MTAECYAHVLSPFIKDTPRFTVPREDYERVLSYFRDSGLDPEPWPNDQELGTIRFVYKGGRAIRICWFWTGHKGPMTFTWAGIRYHTTFVNLSDDATLVFDSAIATSTKNNKNGPLPSRRRRPPKASRGARPGRRGDFGRVAPFAGGIGAASRSPALAGGRYSLRATTNRVSDSSTSRAGLAGRVRSSCRARSAYQLALPLA